MYNKIFELYQKYLKENDLHYLIFYTPHSWAIKIFGSRRPIADSNDLEDLVEYLEESLGEK